MTRGKPKDIKHIVLSGKLFLKYVDDQVLPENGDVLFVLNNDSTSVYKGTYYSTGYAGFFKIFVFDGRIWQHLIENEFFENKENYFSKKEKPIDAFYICEEIMRSKIGTLVYKTYREHYTTYLHIMNAFKGKKGHMKVK
ncbi:MAG: hypothetical protein J0H68_07190 [Sphingobacteriia bacterium]|nr:hypothetical protein [Sphingobacteriia bacterium]